MSGSIDHSSPTGNNKVSGQRIRSRQNSRKSEHSLDMIADFQEISLEENTAKPLLSRQPSTQLTLPQALLMRSKSDTNLENAAMTGPGARRHHTHTFKAALPHSSSPARRRSLDHHSFSPARDRPATQDKAPAGEVFQSNAQPVDIHAKNAADAPAQTERTARLPSQPFVPSYKGLVDTVSVPVETIPEQPESRKNSANSDSETRMDQEQLDRRKREVEQRLMDDWMSQDSRGSAGNSLIKPGRQLASTMSRSVPSVLGNPGMTTSPAEPMANKTPASPDKEKAKPVFVDKSSSMKNLDSILFSVEKYKKQMETGPAVAKIEVDDIEAPRLLETPVWRIDVPKVAPATNGMDKLFKLPTYQYVIHAYKPDSKEPVEGSVSYSELQSFHEALRHWFDTRYPQLKPFVPMFPKALWGPLERVSDTVLHARRQAILDYLNGVFRLPRVLEAPAIAMLFDT